MPWQAALPVQVGPRRVEIVFEERSLDNKSNKMLMNDPLIIDICSYDCSG